MIQVFGPLYTVPILCEISYETGCLPIGYGGIEKVYLIKFMKCGWHLLYKRIDIMGVDSDLAYTATTAFQDGDELVINGSKICIQAGSGHLILRKFPLIISEIPTQT